MIVGEESSVVVEETVVVPEIVEVANVLEVVVTTSVKKLLEEVLTTPVEELRSWWYTPDRAIWHQEGKVELSGYWNHKDVSLVCSRLKLRFLERSLVLG